MALASIVPNRQQAEIDPPLIAGNSPAATALRVVDRIEQSTRCQMAKQCEHAANLLSDIARDEARIGRLLEATRQVPSQKTRDAIVEALGFDHDTAVGFGLRVANEWPMFRNGWAAMHKRDPVSTEEAASVLRTRALELRLMADALRGSRHPDPVARRQRQLAAERMGLDHTTFLLDATNDLAGTGATASGLMGMIKSVLDEMANEKQWELDKRLAAAGMLTIQEFEQARARYSKQFALNRISLVTVSLRFSGSAVALFGAASGDNAASGLDREQTLVDFMEQAAGPAGSF